MAPEVEMVGGGGGAHGAVQHQQRGGASLLNLNTLTSIYLLILALTITHIYVVYDMDKYTQCIHS